LGEIISTEDDDVIMITTAVNPDGLDEADENDNKE
jgi:hypothetical protein